MLTCMQLEELESRLLDVTDLADRYQRNEATFCDSTVGWLSAVETALKHNRLPAAGTVAALRTTVLGAMRGLVPAGVQVQGRATPRKLRQAAAIHALRQAASIVEHTIEPDRQRYREAENVARHLVVAGRAKVLPGFGEGAEQFGDDLRWLALQTDPDTRQAAVQLEGLAGRTNALVLLSRALVQH